MDYGTRTYRVHSIVLYEYEYDRRAGGAGWGDGLETLATGTTGTVLMYDEYAAHD